MDLDRSARDAQRVLADNDVDGRYTRPAAGLYPHQWSWDSAITAIGWAHVAPGRAWTELQTLFAAQWRDGRIPHIVYHRPECGTYFPDAGRWRTAGLTAAHAVATSGIVQPPVHASAALRVWEVSARGDADRAAITDLYPRLLRWHAYLHEHRSDGRGGVLIWHPWESGTDNSPRWDRPLAAVRADPRPIYERADLVHVDAGVRPTDADYDRYVRLLDRLADDAYDDATIRVHHPFRVTDVLTTAILVASDRALGRIADIVEAPTIERDLLAAWVARGEAAVTTARDDATALYVDHDHLADAPIVSRTFAGLAGLVAGIDPQLDTLTGPDFCGAPGLAFPLPPSTSPDAAGFTPRSYWRGPIWPVAVWLLTQALERVGHPDVAARLRSTALDAVGAAGMAEYLDPFTGAPLGAPRQSWTAAVVLDWVASQRAQT